MAFRTGAQGEGVALLPGPRYAACVKVSFMVAQRAASVVLLLFALSPTSAGDILMGQVRNLAQTGIPDVDIDVFDQVTGVKLVTPQDVTDAQGEFEVVVPPGLYRVTFDPANAPGPTLAPKQVFDISVAGTTEIPDVTLVPGIEIVGQVVGSGSAGIANVDLDLIDAGTGTKMFTPGDDTVAGGYFEFVTEPGNYLVRVQPPVSTRLIVAEFGPFPMTTDPVDLTSLLDPLVEGVWLFGTATSSSGVPLAGVDADVRFAGTTNEVPLLGDATGPNGTYQVVVPTGTFDVVFAPPPGSAYEGATYPGVEIAADVVQDATLPVGGSGGGPPTPIALGNRFEGAFSAGQDVDEISFEAVAGMLVSIDARRTTGTARPDFSLFAPLAGAVDLAAHASVSAKGTKATNVALEETGTYRVAFLSANGARGPYSVRTKGKASAALKKVTVQDSVGSPGSIVEVPFLGLAGGKVKGKVLSGGSGLDPSVELLGPGGAPVSLAGYAVSKPSISVTLTGVPLPATGPYTLRVTGANGTTGAFTGKLSVLFPKVPPLLVQEP
ncbi:MAG: carboxypeptidase-like regulatory domain-containing protein [Planctomycetota bacterium]